MSKDCPNCPAFGKHCPHKVSGDPYFYDCYLTVAELEKENAELKHTIATLRQEKDNVSMHAKAMEVVAKTRSEQLTKAKTYLKYFIEILKRLRANKEPLVIEAEQFLNSEVEK